jgi:hypothetical protein
MVNKLEPAYAGPRITTTLPGSDLMRIPPEHRVEKPEFGLYRTLEGWAIWAVFPSVFWGMNAQLIDFNMWCHDRGIQFDIVRTSEQYMNSERGAIVTDENVVMDFKLRWVTHKVEYVFD